MSWKSLRKYVVAALAGATITACGYTGGEKESAPKPANYASQSQQETPHYLAGVPRYSDPIDRLVCKWKTYNTLLTRYPESPPGQERGETSLTNFLDNSIRERVNVFGQDCEIVFNGYIREPGKDGVTFYGGDGRQELSNREFDAVRKDIVSTLTTAADQAYTKHGVVTEKIIETWDYLLKGQSMLGKSDHFRNHLDDIVQEGVTVKDAMYIPILEKKDFVPKKLVFGNIPALGLCYLDSGLVFYDPKARVWDNIDGNPSILVHELTHKNPKLQGMPFAFEFNAETWASLPIMRNDDALTFMAHGYLRDVRHIAKVLFSFDSDRAFRESFFRTAGGVEVKREKLKEYISQINKISAEVQDFALNKFIPEYYAHFSFWSSVNRTLKDTNAALKVNMYAAYEPTLIKDAVETRRWMEKNSLLIKETLEESIKSVEQKKKEPQDEPQISNQNLEMVESYLRSAGVEVTRFSRDELREIAANLLRLGIMR